MPVSGVTVTKPLRGGPFTTSVSTVAANASPRTLAVSVKVYVPTGSAGRRASVGNVRDGDSSTAARASGVRSGVDHANVTPACPAGSSVAASSARGAVGLAFTVGTTAITLGGLPGTTVTVTDAVSDRGWFGIWAMVAGEYERFRGGCVKPHKGCTAGVGKRTIWAHWGAPGIGGGGSDTASPAPRHRDSS